MVIERLSICDGIVGDKLATVVSLNLVSGKTVRCSKEYTLAYIPEFDEWHGDVIAYGEWVDISQEEIAALRMRYSLDDLVRASEDRAL